MNAALILLCPMLLYPACLGWSLAVDHALFGQALMHELADTPRPIVAARMADAWLRALPASYLLFVVVVEPLRRLLASSPRTGTIVAVAVVAAAAALAAALAAVLAWDLAPPAAAAWGIGAANAAGAYAAAACAWRRGVRR